MNIEVTQNPNPDELKTISMGLQAHNTKYIGSMAVEDQFKFVVLAKDNAGKVVGGLRAVAFWNWLNIEVIWVDEQARENGVGRQLLEKAEEYARENDIFLACLETTSFQARGFYEKQGYEVFGKLDDFPKGHKMYFMKKGLGVIRVEKSRLEFLELGSQQSGISHKLGQDRGYRAELGKPAGKPEQQPFRASPQSGRGL